MAAFRASLKVERARTIGRARSPGVSPGSWWVGIMRQIWNLSGRGRHIIDSAAGRRVERGGEQCAIW